jgi:hypothetical protein
MTASGRVEPVVSAATANAYSRPGAAMSSPTRTSPKSAGAHFNNLGYAGPDRKNRTCGQDLGRRRVGYTLES